MTIQIYQNYSSDDKINKNLVLLNSYNNCTLKEETSIINPNILVSYEGVITGNYLYIPDFNRYYFIDNIISVRNNLWRLECKIDPLYTYRSELNNIECILARSENNYNLYLHDNELPIYEDSFTSNILFPNSPLDTWTNVLIVGGSN